MIIRDNSWQGFTPRKPSAVERAAFSSAWILCTHPRHYITSRGLVDRTRVPHDGLWLEILPLALDLLYLPLDEQNQIILSHEEYQRSRASPLPHLSMEFKI